MRRSRRIAAIFSAVALVASFAVACTPPTNPPIDSGTIASQVPLSGTPNFGPTVTTGFGPTVDAVAQAGGYMVAGGTFTTVNGNSQPYLAAWAAPSGANFTALPDNTVDGEVDAIEPYASGAGFYAAGHFKKAVNGTVTTSVDRLQPRSKEDQPAVPDGRRRHHQHYAAGGKPPAHRRLLHPRERRSCVRAGLGQRHDRCGRQLPPDSPRGPPQLQLRQQGNEGQGQVGGHSMAVSPDGSRMIVIGNFTAASTTSQHQDRLRA